MLHIFRTSFPKKTFGWQLLKIDNGFNKFFTEIGPKHASSIPTFSKNLLLLLALVIFLIKSSILLVFQCKQEFFHISKKHAVMQLISQILHDFNENKCTICIFIDLSRAFDTTDHDTFFKKIDMYDTKGKKFKMVSQLPNKQRTNYKT